MTEESLEQRAQTLLGRKKTWAHKLLEPVFSNLMRANYDLRFEGANTLRRLKGKPVVAIPKHQHDLDPVLVAGMFRQAAWDAPYQIMKAELPAVLEHFGGIRVVRGREIKKVRKDREARRRIVKEARETEALIYGHLFPQVMRQRDAMVVFVEGTVHYQQEAGIPLGNLEKLYELQERLGPGTPITYVPIDIEYEAETQERLGPWNIPLLGKKVGPISIPQRGTGITVRVGKPLPQPQRAQDLGEHLAREIPLLTYEGKKDRGIAA